MEGPKRREAEVDSASSVVPPDKFGTVEPQVYRSAFPTPESFEHLERLRLRTAVNLSQELPMSSVLSRFAETGIQLMNIGLSVWTHQRCPPISNELIRAGMELLLDRSYHPILLISSSGTHQVGTLVGCLRRLQQWNLASILDEYRSFAAPSPRLSCEQIIELWDPDLVQIAEGAQPPSWYQVQVQMQQADVASWRQHCLDLHTSHSGVVVAHGESKSSGEAMGGLQEYFRVSGPLASPGTCTTLIQQDDVVGD